jgi:hypothetical protein
MDRVGVFVDAGYLLAEGSRLLTGAREPSPRDEVNLNNKVVVDVLTERANRTGLPLLRIYWYDGVLDNPTAQHQSLASLPNVKVRLGVVNRSGEQKGVDALIITDLIELARNRAIADAVLVSGDEDMRVGVQQCQEFGVRVHLIGVAPWEENQSRSLRQEADTLDQLEKTDIEKFLSLKFPVLRLAAPHAEDLPSGCNPYQVVGSAVAEQLSTEELEMVLSARAATKRIPSQVYKFLRTVTGDALGKTDLTYSERTEMLAGFIAACVDRLSTRKPSAREFFYQRELFLRKQKRHF